MSRAKILGNAELFIKSGSDINLTCLAMQSPVPPSFIYWYKGKRVMNYSQRGGINVITERSTRTSKLLIAKATSADSGNYTCSPSSSGEFPHFPSGHHLPSPPCPASCASLLVLQRRAEQLHLHLTPTRTMLLSLLLLLLTQTPTSLSCCLSMCQSPVSFYCRWQLM